MIAPRRPALRWHGGKWLLAPWIIQHFGPHRVYVEPFGGAASVLLRKQRSYAEIYNDLDDDVVNLFKVLRQQSQAKELIRFIEMTPFARCEFLGAYELKTDPVERARDLVIRSFMGFGSNGHSQKTGFRSCSNRSGTTPAHDWQNIPENLKIVADRLRGCIIENKDASAVMLQHDSENTLHFVDPPYLFETRGNARDDYAVELTDEDHKNLLQMLLTLRGSVVLAGYPSSMYNEALTEWVRFDREALADGARKRTECLWLNESAQNGIAQQGLFA